MQKNASALIKYKNLLATLGASKINNTITVPVLGLNNRKNYNFISLSKYTELIKLLQKKNSSQKIILGNGLKQFIKQNINFLINNKTYSGSRHKANLPVRGQRTRTNAKTCKK